MGNSDHNLSDTPLLGPCCARTRTRRRFGPRICEARVPYSVLRVVDRGANGERRGVFGATR